MSNVKYNPKEQGLAHKNAKGIELIAIERSEQVNKHNRTIESDFYQNENSQLAIGAMMLLSVDFEEFIDPASYPQGWDNDICDKMISKTYKERLVIAGALIAAEIDRINFKNNSNENGN